MLPNKPSPISGPITTGIYFHTFKSADGLYFGLTRLSFRKYISWTWTHVASCVRSTLPLFTWGPAWSVNWEHFSLIADDQNIKVETQVYKYISCICSHHINQPKEVIKPSQMSRYGRIIHPPWSHCKGGYYMLKIYKST